MKTCLIDGCEKTIDERYDVCWAHSNHAQFEEAQQKYGGKKYISPKNSSSTSSPSYSPKVAESLSMKSFSADSPDQLEFSVNQFRKQLKKKYGITKVIRATQIHVQQAYALGEGVVKPLHIAYVFYDDTGDEE